MYSLLHDGEILGSTLFESADPEAHSVSGQFNNAGGPIALSGWIMSNGGAEEGEVIYLNLMKSFEVHSQASEPLFYDEATLIAVPNENEAFIELIIHDEATYEKFLMQHTVALAGEDT